MTVLCICVWFIQLTHSTSASSSHPVCSSQRSIDSDPQSSNTTSLPAASETNADGELLDKGFDLAWFSSLSSEHFCVFGLRGAVFI